MSNVTLPESVILSLYNSPRHIELRNLTFLDYGGQGQIYTFTYNNQKFLLKAIFRDDRRLLRTMHEIRLKLLKSDTLPESVKFRTLPIGQGCCEANLFENMNSFKVANLFAFNFLEGIPLTKFLEDGLPSIESNDDLKGSASEDFNIRKNLATDIAAIFSLMEVNGIVHGDLYDDNLLVDMNGTVHLIDIEGSGIMRGNNWEWEPLSKGKIGYLRPAEDVKVGKNWVRIPTIYTDRWDGINLIFRVLTGKNTPFFFLPKLDPRDINNLISAVNTQKYDWLPRNGVDGRLVLSWPYEDLKLFFESFPVSLRSLFFQAFITGYNSPNKRPLFREIYEALKRIE